MGTTLAQDVGWLLGQRPAALGRRGRAARPPASRGPGRSRRCTAPRWCGGSTARSRSRTRPSAATSRCSSCRTGSCSRRSSTSPASTTAGAASLPAHPLADGRRRDREDLFDQALDGTRSPARTGTGSTGMLAEPRRVAHPQRRLGEPHPPPVARGLGARRARVHAARPVPAAPRGPRAQRAGAHGDGPPRSDRPVDAGLRRRRRAAAALRRPRRRPRCSSTT